MKPIKIIPDNKYPDMYRLQWANGDISVGSVNPKPWEKGGHYGFYNKTVANDILNNYDEYVRNMEMRGNTRASKSIGRALDCIP